MAFWKWYDRAARVDFLGTVLGWFFEWRPWIASAVGGGGGAVTFIWSAIDGKSALEVWVLSVVVTTSLIGACWLGLKILDRFRLEPTPSHDESQRSDLMGRWQRGEWQITYPPLKGEARIPAGYLSLREAATRAYERTRNTLLAGMAENESETPDEILRYYGYFIAVIENSQNNNKPLVSLFGIRPPSRQLETIKPTPRYELTVGQLDSYLSENKKIVFENLAVKADELEVAIQKMCEV